MSDTKVSLVITGTIVVNRGHEEEDVDTFIDEVAGLGMTITEIETYE